MSTAVAGENWPQWRGPDASGASDSTGLAAEWSPEKNIVWKTPLPSWASSTPIVWNDRLYVVSPSAPEAEENAGAGNEGGPTMMLLCLSLKDGSVLWQKAAAGENKMFRKHNASTPSPVTDGRHIYTVTGLGAITAFDMDGGQKWTFDLTKTYGTIGTRHGYASSPVIVDGKLIVQTVHGYGTNEPSYVMAFDAASGDIAWRVERPTDAPERSESLDAYTTPVVLEHDGKHQVVVVGADYVTGYDPADGAELWRVGGMNPKRGKVVRMVASPLLAGGVLYAPSRKGPVLALDAAKAAAGAEDCVLWSWNEPGAPDVPTPACDGTLFFMSSDDGMVTCLDAKTGEQLWGPEETGIGTVSASPVLADGKLYLTAEDGVTAVMEAGRSFKLIAKNELDGSYTLSSPAISGRHLFIRTAEHLYCIGTAEGDN
jgi:outer membrane protein assembly factor BamB